MLTCIAYGSITARAAPPVTVAEDAGGFTLANGIVTARITRHSGNLTSLVYRGSQLLAARGGGYWSHTPASVPTIESVTIDPTANGGDRAEVSVRGTYAGRPLGSGPGGGVAADIEIRYALERGLSGVYTYTILHHRPEYPFTAIGEARYAAKLDDAFDWMTVDARRSFRMPTASDWNHGIVMNMKEARLLTTGEMKGRVEHKYDYSAVQFDTPAFGWSSTAKQIGFWFVNPTIEYLSGGPTKLELTAHRDATFNVGPQYYDAPAAPTVLNYWRGSHYGGASAAIAPGEDWTKVVGPFLIYCNSGPSPGAMWRDALARAAIEARAWPYGWVSGVDYPHRPERGAVSGRIVLKDPVAPGARLGHLLVGLAHPDYALATVSSAAGRGPGQETVDWQRDAKFYQFWSRGDGAGRFTIPAVRPGVYTLHAIADGVLGEFARTDVSVKAGKTLDLGALIWTPMRTGRPLWEIGIPDRTAGEFRSGDHYWQWGLYLRYPKEFPDDVNYLVGKSDWRRDWNLMQVPRADPADTTGRGRGAATTWTVSFDLPSAPRGRGALRVAIAGMEAPYVGVAVNDREVGRIRGLVNNGAIHRDADRGYWQEARVDFDAACLRKGANTLKLTVPAGPVTAGIEYDYLRLELDEAAEANRRPVAP
ncbi:MAG TPA: polysaccharide lyase family protein [Chthonomonadaceae bacterium]|nr:polysaccharide lyase family protein [Chthonomonadaceae bacterium]